MNKKNVFVHWLTVLILIGVSTTLFLWQALITQQRPQIKQAIRLDAASTKKPVHPSVTDDGITTDELIQIYQGKKSRWQNGHEIIVLTRDPEESSIKLLEQEVLGFKEAYAESQQANRWVTVY